MLEHGWIKRNPVPTSTDRFTVDFGTEHEEAKEAELTRKSHR